MKVTSTTTTTQQQPGHTYKAIIRKFANRTTAECRKLFIAVIVVVTLAFLCVCSYVCYLATRTIRQKQ